MYLLQFLQCTREQLTVNTDDGAGTASSSSPFLLFFSLSPNYIFYFASDADAMTKVTEFGGSANGPSVAACLMPGTGMSVIGFPSAIFDGNNSPFIKIAVPNAGLV